MAECTFQPKTNASKYLKKRGAKAGKAQPKAPSKERLAQLANANLVRSLFACCAFYNDFGGWITLWMCFTIRNEKNVFKQHGSKRRLDFSKSARLNPKSTRKAKKCFGDAREQVENHRPSNNKSKQKQSNDCMTYAQTCLRLMFSCSYARCGVPHA